MFAWRADGRSARGANIVHDHDAAARFLEALDATASPMRLLRLPDQETVDPIGFTVEVLGAGGEPGLDRLRAQDADPGDDRVRPKSHAADRLRVPPPVLDLVQHNTAGEPGSFRVQRRGAAVDVVVAGTAGRELELAEPERLHGQERE
jgi:hypothetical protein